MVCSQVCWTIQATEKDGQVWYPNPGRPLYMHLYDTAVAARGYARQMRKMDGRTYKAVRVMVNIELAPNEPHPTVRINRRPR